MFRLQRSDRRHALAFVLAFVEGWNTTRIAISGSVPWLASSLVGIIWTAAGGDAQTAFTVASFILTSSSSGCSSSPGWDAPPPMGESSAD